MDAIRKELEKKAFGELKFFVANLMHDYMHIERLKNKENGGGVVLELVFSLDINIQQSIIFLIKVWEFIWCS